MRANDLRAASAALDQAFAVLSLHQALTDVVTPALRWTGEAWHRGELSVAQEHALTTKVRVHLSTFVSGGQGGVHGTAVLACAPGERHDVGLLMLAVMLRGDGWRIEFLGADTPTASAISFAESAGASILCFSASRPESVHALRDALGTSSSAGPQLVFGGSAVTPTIARRLRGTYGDGRLDVAVARLRKLASR